jgi:hypothetical protein
MQYIALSVPGTEWCAQFGATKVPGRSVGCVGGAFCVGNFGEH